MVLFLQGVSRFGDVTTLGRGGSDTSAVALAAAFRADLCQIYTDVDGVYTTDPRIVPGAKKLLEITYDETVLQLDHRDAGHTGILRHTGDACLLHLDYLLDFGGAEGRPGL